MRRPLVLGVAVVVIGVAAIVVALTRSGSAGAGRGDLPSHALPAAPPVAGHPLLAGDAATFSGGTGGWSSSDATLSVSTTTKRSAPGALAVTGSGSLSAWSPSRPARSGDRYVGSAWVRAATAARGVRAELRFLDAGGTVTDTAVGQSITDAPGSWRRLDDVVALAPKGTRSVQFGVALPVVGAGARHLVDSVSLDATPGPAPPVVGPLHVLGNSIVDGHGRTLVLRGMQRFGLEGGTNNPLPTAAEIAQLKGWGANEVRLSLGEQKWLTSSCHYVAGYPKTVDKVVSEVTSRGMVALLNLHFSTLSSCGKPGLQPMADSPGALTFWQEVASRYRDNPLVAFDLFNEPHVPPSVWLDGGSFTVSSGPRTHPNNNTVQAAGMQQMYDTVRATGATNLVVVSGLDYAAQPPQQTVEGADIAYGMHVYTCPTAPPPRCTSPRPYDAAPIMSRWLDFARSHAVLVSEFGFPNGNDGRFNTSVIDYADAHHWGWSGFAWDGSTTGLFDLLAPHPASDGTYEPNPAGMPLVAGFAANVTRR